MEVKLLIVDDHPMLLRGLREALAQRPGFEPLGEAAGGFEALALARQLTPDVVIMDLRMPGMDGFEATRQLVKLLPSVKVIVYSIEVSRSVVDQALKAGAAGYLAKNCAIDEVFDAIEVVMQGKVYLSPKASADIFEDYRESLVHGGRPAKPVHSDRERLLLQLVAAGCRNKEIATQLCVTTKSVETYRSRLMKRLHCASTAELVRYAIREGIVTP